MAVTISFASIAAFISVGRASLTCRSFSIMAIITTTRAAFFSTHTLVKIASGWRRTVKGASKLGSPVCRPAKSAQIRSGNTGEENVGVAEECRAGCLLKYLCGASLSSPLYSKAGRMPRIRGSTAKCGAKESDSTSRVFCPSYVFIVVLAASVWPMELPQLDFKTRPGM
eukprot:5473218-Amphidinium_carterae.1